MKYKLYENNNFVGYSDTLLSNYTCIELTEDEKIFLNEKENAIDRIRELKDMLSSQDFKTIKFIQGKLSQEEFDKVVAQCDEWRKEINELEAKYGII